MIPNIQFPFNQVCSFREKKIIIFPFGPMLKLCPAAADNFNILSTNKT